MSTVAYGYGAVDTSWKGDSKSDRRMNGAAAVTVLAKGLELEEMNLSLINFDEFFEPLDFFRDGKSLLRQQTAKVVFGRADVPHHRRRGMRSNLRTAKVVFGRADVPTVFVKFWTPAPVFSPGFWMAGRNERGKRLPNCDPVE